MSSSSQKGNDQPRWEKFLNALDEKLQLGLLGKLNRVSSYHFEANDLYIQPLNTEDVDYLQREAVFYQLQLLAQDAIGVTKVEIKKPE